MKLSKIILEGWNDNDVEGKLSQLDYGTISSYFDGEPFSAPNTDDSLTKIFNEENWERWKSYILDKFGDVGIKLDKDAVWYDKVKIIDPAFNKRRQDYSDAKARTIDQWRSEPGYYAGD